MLALQSRGNWLCAAVRLWVTAEEEDEDEDGETEEEEEEEEDGDVIKGSRLNPSVHAAVVRLFSCDGGH